MVLNRDIYRFQNKLFDIVVYVTWILYIVIALGLSANAPQYLYILHTFIKLYVSFFLIYRFNPFRRVKLTALDAKIAFSAGLFLLTTTAIDGILKTYLSNGVKFINDWFYF
jgi:hypothetical protein